MAETMRELRFRVPNVWLDELRAVAVANDRTTAQEGRHALKLYLQMVKGRPAFGDDEAA